MTDQPSDERAGDVRRQLRELIDRAEPVTMDELRPASAVAVPLGDRTSGRSWRVAVAAGIVLVLAVTATVAIISATTRAGHNVETLGGEMGPGPADEPTGTSGTSLPPGPSPFAAIPTDGMVLDVVATPDTIYLGVQDVGDDAVFEHRLLEVDPTTGATRRSTTIGLTPGGR